MLCALISSPREKRRMLGWALVAIDFWLWWLRWLHSYFHTLSSQLVEGRPVWVVFVIVVIVVFVLSLRQGLTV